MGGGSVIGGVRSTMRVCEVAVVGPVRKTYTYEVPGELTESLEEGCRVVVPFKGKRTVTGFVLSVTDLSEAPDYALRPVVSLVEGRPVLTPDLLRLAAWMAEYYVCSLGEALGTIFPAHRNMPFRRIHRLVVSLDGALKILGRRGPRQAEALRFLARNRESGADTQACEAAGIVAATLRGLRKKGWVRLEHVPETMALPEGMGRPELGAFPRLVPDQQRIVDAVGRRLDENRPGVDLVHGVTGSGKTEVYLALIRKVVEEGGSAIFLVPEIAITIPMIDLLRSRFGSLAAILHSGLSPVERYGEWLRIARGEARLVLGARSSSFAPLTELRLIVMDEEAEGSYKQQDKPRYHTREVVLERARQVGATVIFGSASPSLEVFREAREGRYGYHVLAERFNRQPMPEVSLVDMAQEFEKKRNRSIFSEDLKAGLAASIDRGEQALLFLNRRGHSTYVFCRSCGEALGCSRCSVTLTYHRSTRRLCCHLCGAQQRSPETCPACGSKAIRYCGGGTQKVEEEFSLNFPGVRHARLDSDTTSRRGAHREIIGRFSAGKEQVLIGTQMVAKGFDFPRLTFAGVVNADSVLRLPDFRGAEKTFQLVLQVAGRVGRADRPGTVVVQTYQPEHYALKAGAAHDYEAFASEELAFRQALSYPPYARLILVLAEGPTEARVQELLSELRSDLMALELGEDRLIALGPSPAPIERINENFRWQLLLKLPGEDEEAQRRVKAVLAGARPKKSCALKIDVDPGSVL